MDLLLNPMEGNYNNGAATRSKQSDDKFNPLKMSVTNRWTELT